MSSEDGRTIVDMKRRTQELWAKQDQHAGDRWRLFKAVAETIDASTVLYPGSYVDVAPSFVFPRVTYVDVDRRAAAFFDDREGVEEIIRSHPGSPRNPQFMFIHGDYAEDLGLPDEGFDLLVSLYAGPVSDHCVDNLSVGGSLLVNPSHGDAALASIDERLSLTGVVLSRSGGYRSSDRNLGDYLTPKAEIDITREMMLKRGRGIAYTKPAFAFIFERIR